MTFEPFHCTFVGDSRGFKVTPEEGTLNRRGGDPQELDVSYKGNVGSVHLRRVLSTKCILRGDVNLFFCHQALKFACVGCGFIHRQSLSEGPEYSASSSMSEIRCPQLLPLRGSQASHKPSFCPSIHSRLGPRRQPDRNVGCGDRGR